MAVVPSLPQELVDLIIDAVYSSDGTTPLKALSTVSRTWRPYSQRIIFRKFILDHAMMTCIHSETTDIIESTEGTQQGLPIVFSYVQELQIFALQVTSPEGDAMCLETLRLFTNVTSLRIRDWDFREFDAHSITHFLSHFGATVRTLKLHECHVDSEVLILLTSLFPLVDILEVDPRYPGLRAVTYKVQTSNRPSKRVEFRGNLIFRFLGYQHEEFLAFVNDHFSDVHSISVEHCVNVGELQRLFDCRGGKLSSVSVYSFWKRAVVSLSSCTRLRTLSIRLMGGGFNPSDPNWKVLSTLTSPHLEEINIYLDAFSVMSERSLTGWEEIDEHLCRNYDRCHRNGFRDSRVNLYPKCVGYERDYSRLVEYAREAWPGFASKGAVISSVETGRETVP